VRGTPAAQAVLNNCYLRRDRRLKTDLGLSRFTVGVNNVLDKSPQRVYGGVEMQTDARTYDFMGRFIYLRLTQSF
jgi:outer membrane receptor protein involved in Fe transport